MIRKSAPFCGRVLLIPIPACAPPAIRALCDTSDAELLPDVLKLARELQEENYRTLAIRAAVRLATQDESAKLTNPQRAAR